MVSVTWRNCQQTTQKKYRQDNVLLPTFSWYTSYFLYARIANLRVYVCGKLYTLKPFLNSRNVVIKAYHWSWKEWVIWLLPSMGQIFKFRRWRQMSIELIFGFLICLETSGFSMALWSFYPLLPRKPNTYKFQFDPTTRALATRVLYNKEEKCDVKLPCYQNFCISTIFLDRDGHLHCRTMEGKYGLRFCS